MAPRGSRPSTTTPAGLTVDVTYDGSATAPIDAGSYAIVGDGQRPELRRVGNGTLVVNKADQTIAFAPLADKTFGDPDFSVSASATSGLGVGFAASGKCTVTGSSVHLTGAASCTITATRPESELQCCAGRESELHHRQGHRHSGPQRSHPDLRRLAPRPPR